MELRALGKWLIGTGLFLALIGVVMTLAGKIPYLGHLPGDIYIKKEHFSFYFPLVTCVILSVLFSLILQLFGRK